MTPAGISGADLKELRLAAPVTLRRSRCPAFRQCGSSLIQQNVSRVFSLPSLPLCSQVLSRCVLFVGTFSRKSPALKLLTCACFVPSGLCSVSSVTSPGFTSLKSATDSPPPARRDSDLHTLLKADI